MKRNDTAHVTIRCCAPEYDMTAALSHLFKAYLFQDSNSLLARNTR